MCTSGLSYITIDNYELRNNGKQDDVRFEFKSSQSSGMIMYAGKGISSDFIYVAYKDSRVFMLYINLGSGNELVTFFTTQFILVCTFAANNFRNNNCRPSTVNSLSTSVWQTQCVDDFCSGC